MSMMECGHCARPCEGRSMQICGQCGRAICDECRTDGDCPECGGEDDRSLRTMR